MNIKDVAKAAGVSVSTVSRVINDSPSISTKTKEKVLKEIKRLNYSPNSIAKGLINNKSYTVTLIVDVDDEKSFQNPFFYEIMHGIERYVYKKEFSLIVANINTTMKKRSILDWLIREKRTEGVILPSSILSSKLVNELKNDGIPFVSIGEPTNLKEPVSWVDIDNKKGTETATYSLLDKGYKNIAFLGLDKSKLFSKRRYEGYRNAIIESKQEVDENLVIECSNSKDDGYIHMKNLLNSPIVPGAVICSDNNISFGVLRAIQEAGLAIPKDIGVISFDNQQIAELSYPTITTVDVEVFELGYQSAKLLFDMLEDPQIRDQGLLISTTIEERESTL